MCIGNWPIHSFLSCTKGAFSTSSESLVIKSKRSEMSSFGLVLFHFLVVSCANSYKNGRQNGVTCNNLVDISVFYYETVWQVLDSGSIHRKKLLIDNWSHYLGFLKSASTNFSNSGLENKQQGSKRLLFK